MSLYYIDMKDATIPLQSLRLFYNGITLGMVLFFFIDLKIGFESWWHEQFNTICILTVMINYILIILIHAKVLDDSFKEVIIFNGSVFVTSIMILISGGRHNVFKS